MTWVTLQLQSWCVTNCCSSVLPDPQVPAPELSSGDIAANAVWMWQTAFLLHLCLSPQRETSRRNTIKSTGDGGREHLRFNSTKLICQRNLITVIDGKSFIVLPRQAHPCPTLFCYQNFFHWSNHIFPGAGWSQLLPVHLGRGREQAGGPVTPCLTLMGLWL